ncbi:hypothetical protein IMAU20120_01498 [Lactiplantibacillus plantarum]|nr:hypothetical protein [Lactiplantibacillus plantarum]MCG0592907.1 hypothetical protein [Lactiplantibacillus plantarum]MCG0597895.1 hypothetical protein [Lactiplantibacillus plantarum]MCG0601161.1 hypothetical protein [Lactiplantibacillus plantarum]MCG0604118.1 hypothetical protein [Lactiplantibacillus plantarum]
MGLTTAILSFTLSIVGSFGGAYRVMGGNARQIHSDVKCRNGAGCSNRLGTFIKENTLIWRRYQPVINETKCTSL